MHAPFLQVRTKKIKEEIQAHVDPYIKQFDGAETKGFSFQTKKSEGQGAHHVDGNGNGQQHDLRYPVRYLDKTDDAGQESKTNHQEQKRREGKRGEKRGKHFVFILLRGKAEEAGFRAIGQQYHQERHVSH